MDDTTKILWRAADAATAAEVRHEAKLGKDGRNDGKASVARVIAWARLIAHRRRMHKQAMEGKDAVA